jgi:hypothetical protein
MYKSSLYNRKTSAWCLMALMLLAFMYSCKKSKTPDPYSEPLIEIPATVIGKFEVKDDKILDSTGVQFVPQGVKCFLLFYPLSTLLVHSSAPTYLQITQPCIEYYLLYPNQPY